MIKRIIALLLVFSIIFAFASCKKMEEPEETPIPTQIPTVKVTIPEGYTLLRISWLLEEKGLCTSEEFINLAQTYDEWVDFTKHPFLEDLKNQENVCFALEGYIFPLTYDIPENATAKDILIMFLNGTKRVFNDDFMTRIEQSGFSLHEILTLASIIEKEARLDEQRPMVSSVIHNRINAGMKIQCDPTKAYWKKVIAVEYPEQAESFAKFYDTYECEGLMAGPICNPGIKSIDAAINPADTDYLYFIIGMVEPYISKYSKTWKEHDKFHRENYKLIYGDTRK